MPGDLKDISVIIDGADPLADTVRAGIALRLAYHHGASITVFVQGDLGPEGHIDWSAATEDTPYPVEICGISESLSSDRFGRRSPMSELFHEVHARNAWIRHSNSKELLEQGHCADLIIVGSPPTLQPKSAAIMLDVVTGVGRPVLVVPQKFAQRRRAERQIGHRVLTAWNATAPCARAVHDALPFLRRAEEVTVLFVNENKESSRARKIVESIASHLARHEVKARPEVVVAGDQDPARVILDRLAELDINLLVMGAFSRSRLAETWLGGVSENLLHNVTVPILTSH